MYNKTLTSIIATIAITLYGCGNEQALNTEPQSDQTVSVNVTLNIGVRSGMHLAADDSRADGDDYIEPRRPLSWTGQQKINDMRIYVFESDSKDGDYLYAGGGDCPDGGYLVPDFNNDLPVSGADESHVFAFTPKLKKDKYYKFLAVGRDDTHGLEIPSIPKVVSIPWGTKTMSDANFIVGVTEIHSATLRNMLDEGHYPYVTTEIFAGVMTFEASDGKTKEDYIHVSNFDRGFQKHIILKRAVAALWIYVTDIPNEIVDNSGSDLDGEKFNPHSLRIHMESSSPELSLLYDFSNDKENISMYQMVGFLDFNNNYGRKGELWHFDSSSPFWLRNAFEFDGEHIKENSALITNYLIPFDAPETIEERLSTLHLQLYENILGMYEFNCSIRCDIKSITDPITGEKHEYNGDPYKYPILPNCIYALGSPDQPYSLSKLLDKLSRGETPELEMQCIPIE